MLHFWSAWELAFWILGGRGNLAMPIGESLCHGDMGRGEWEDTGEAGTMWPPTFQGREEGTSLSQDPVSVMLSVWNSSSLRSQTDFFRTSLILSVWQWLRIRFTVWTVLINNVTQLLLKGIYLTKKWIHQLRLRIFRSYWIPR